MEFLKNQTYVCTVVHHCLYQKHSHPMTFLRDLYL